MWYSVLPELQTRASDVGDADSFKAAWTTASALLTMLQMLAPVHAGTAASQRSWEAKLQLWWCGGSPRLVYHQTSPNPQKRHESLVNKDANELGTRVLSIPASLTCSQAEWRHWDTSHITSLPKYTNLPLTHSCGNTTIYRSSRNIHSIWRIAATEPKSRKSVFSPKKTD